MKRRGRHPDNDLNALKVKALKEPGRYADGGGLYLEVDRFGSKRWLLRIQAQGRRRDLGLGSLRDVGLAEAREKATELRKVARAGNDPVAFKRHASRAVPSFQAAAEKVHATHTPGWRNAKHADQWLSTLRLYAFPTIGSRRVDQITTADILAVLTPIWLAKPETARRVKQRLRTVLDWASAAGHREGQNPVDAVRRGLPRQPERNDHHAAMRYADVPEFVRSIQGEGIGEIARLAFELLILTAARTGEVLGARKGEFDLDKKLWMIPAERMKAGREHRVPLSPRAVDVVRRATLLSADDDLVFPSNRPGRPLSNMTLLALLRRRKIDATAHGMRSSFRDWASERTNFPPAVAEAALAHAVKDKTERAYARSDLFERRRQLMNAWAGYVMSEPGKVVRLQAGSSR